ncbi:MAG TPA: hypothetical protein VH989_08815, partial [Actinomycetota bacterium]
MAAIRALGGSLTALPKPLESSTLRVSGQYRLARHPIYGGLLLDAVAGSLLSSPIPLIPTALLVVLFELKSRHEESMLGCAIPTTRRTGAAFATDSSPACSDASEHRVRVRAFLGPGL